MGARLCLAGLREDESRVLFQERPHVRLARVWHHGRCTWVVKYALSSFEGEPKQVPP